MRLLYLFSWSTDWLINLSELGLMCLVWLVMMMTHVYASRRRSSDRCSCRGMHQLDLEGSSLWCCSPWCLPKRGYSGTYTIENILSSRLTMASKVYNTTITTAVKLIQKVWAITTILVEIAFCRNLILLFPSSQMTIKLNGSC